MGSVVQNYPLLQMSITTLSFWDFLPISWGSHSYFPKLQKLLIILEILMVTCFYKGYWEGSRFMAGLAKRGIGHRMGQRIWNHRDL